MVLIISKHGEYSTDQVMDWLYYKGEPCYRLNGENILNDNSNFFYEFSSNEENSSVIIEDKEIVNSNKITSIWYRRDEFAQFKKHINDVLVVYKNEVRENILRHLYDEYIEGKNALYSCLESDKKKLGNFRKSAINKIETLILAKGCGIEIPATLVTNSKTCLEKFIKKNGEIITKAIKSPFIFLNENEMETHVTYTEEITKKVLEGTPDVFLHSLFQEKLNKEIEIRTFFLNGQCYSMAIFSQLDSQTSIDFRKYNAEVNNRNVPYKLPEILEENIVKLMALLDLNTGSIDIIKTKDGRFVFLEVNPVGQYSMTSVPCNYHLDKKIAEYLINHD